jgi:hypothetical protein
MINKFSKRSIVAYPNAETFYNTLEPMTSNPAAPVNSQQSNMIQGKNPNANLCPKCKSITLIFNNKDFVCPKCGGRYSDKEFNTFNQAYPTRQTALLNMDSGSNSMPSAHVGNEYGTGSASRSWGKN